jgi:type I restriction enzyme S subunit
VARTKWKPYQLDELGFVGRGKSRHRPRNDARLYGGPYPFIQTADVMAADPYITSCAQTYSEFGLEQSKMWPPDTLCMTIAGANTAKTAILKIQACFPDSVVGFISDKSKADLYFVKYSLDLMKHRFLAVSRGATQDNLSVDKLLSFPILAPCVEDQRRIGAILSTYEDLMENNRQRIRILESMARAVYREWFVCFRFPGHKNTKRVDSPLGAIPNGWEVKKLKDACQLTMGQSPKSEFYNETGKGLPFHQGVTNFGDRFPIELLFCTVEARLAEAGDILFSVRAPVGRMNIADKKMIIGRGLSAIRSQGGHQAFLWEQLRARFTRDDMMGNGAIFAAVTKDDMQGIELLCPPAALLQEATRYFEPLHSEIGVLAKQTVNLRRTRDLLLPRLLSGQVNLETN